MISNSLLGSAIVCTSICLTLIPINNHDPWDHWQVLLLWKCGIFFKVMVLQLSELNFIKQ
jgi:hypothetical protein